MQRAFPIAPFLAALFGIGVYCCMDAVMKGLSISLGAYNASLWRMVVALPMMAGVYFVRREPWPSRVLMRLHILRGTVAVAMLLLWFWGIVRVPLAEGIALSFIAPLITLYLAAVLLHEPVHAREIVASVVALLGIGVIILGRLGVKHGPDALWGVIAILVAAVLYAYNLVLQRQQAQAASPQAIGFFNTLVVLVWLLLFAPHWAMLPSHIYWPMIILGAFLGSAAIIINAWAYGRAEARIVVMSEYTAFIWAALLGYIFFQEPITSATLAGTVLIVLGCLLVVRTSTGVETGV
ncbi:MAG: DMT family transporter [Alphaproteobacteria bacterium]|nr:DMT family transporter [Alphaproteobacteria bacterium]MDE2340437.1 DMT family transporter [Alphaproteobacteria bacterium]